MTGATRAGALPAEDWLDELFAYIQTFDPEFRTGIVPASAADIDRLSALVGQDLPAEYRAFLAVMGGRHGDGGLFHNDFANFDIAQVLDYCRRVWDDGAPPRSVIPIAIEVLAYGEAFALLTAEAGERPVVHLGSDGNLHDAGNCCYPGRRLYQSLPAMCFTAAFGHEMWLAGQSAIIQPAPYGAAALAAADELVARGYTRQWFSNDSGCFLRRAGTLIVISVPEPIQRGTRPGWCVGGHDTAAIDAGLADLVAVADISPTWDRNSRMTLPEIRANPGWTWYVDY